MSGSKKFTPDPLALEIVELADRFHAAGLWHRLRDQQPFVIRWEGHERPILTVVTGHGRQDGGLLISMADSSLAIFLDIIESGSTSDDFETAFSWLTMAYLKLKELSSAQRRFIESAGVRSDANRRVPNMIAKDAYATARIPKRAELRALAAALRTTLAAAKAGVLNPIEVSRDQRDILCLRADRSCRAVTVALVPMLELFPVVVDEGLAVELPEELALLPRREASLLCSGRAFAGDAADGKRARLQVTIVDATSGTEVGGGLPFADDHAALSEILTETFRARHSDGEPMGLPTRVIFANRQWHRSFEHSLRALGIESTFDPGHPALKFARPSWAARSESPGREDPSTRPQRYSQFTVSEWEALIASRAIALEQLDCVRARQIFFGREEIPPRAVHYWGIHAVHGSYIEWLLADYRPVWEGPTYVERRLADPTTPEPERRVCQSRRDRHVSLFRVRSVDPGHGFEVEDTVDRKTYYLADWSMAKTVRLDDYLVLRLLPIDGNYLPAPAGPTLSLVEAVQLFHMIDNMSVKYPEYPLQYSMATGFGQLWAMVARNLDFLTLPGARGSPGFEWIIGRFRVSQYDTLIAALGARPDVVPSVNAESHKWFWLGAPRYAHELDRPRLATIELLGDELLVEVHSRRAFEQASEWLLAVDGVRFEAEVKRTPHEVPADDRLAAIAASRGRRPEPGESTEAFFERVRRSITALLDQVDPALDNLTPREACKVPGWRRSLYRTIQLMPNPIVVPELRAIFPFDEIRAGLLRELGLDADAGMGGSGGTT